jgi:hypothetical protein
MRSAAEQKAMDEKLNLPANGLDKWVDEKLEIAAKNLRDQEEEEKRKKKLLDKKKLVKLLEEDQVG